MMPVRLVIADAEQWRRVTDALGASLPELQGVDFSREMIVLVAAGLRPTTAYTITIDSVTREGAELVVSVRQTSPGPRCGVGEMETTPVDAVRIPERTRRVRFVDRSELHECPP
jgi:SH3-like domain-containing protein